jgi:hypothetical protein
VDKGLELVPLLIGRGIDRAQFRKAFGDGMQGQYYPWEQVPAGNYK